MSIILTEGQLQFTFNNVISARKFDDSTHGLSNCMKAVDLIVERDDRYLFIEVKDPQAYPPSIADYIEDFIVGRVDEGFKYKYRDSFLYEWASGRADKPIYYFMLIGLDILTPEQLLARQAAMETKLPSIERGIPQWTRPIVTRCSVFNVATWNQHLPDYPVRRLP